MMYECCLEAQKIGLEQITILELGVAGGNGILCLEQYKKKIEKISNIKINIIGFDTGEGLPDSNDKRGVLFFIRKGNTRSTKKN